MPSGTSSGRSPIKAVLTDTQFWVPFAVFLMGIGILIFVTGS
jgi:hypothetical protein